MRKLLAIAWKDVEQTLADPAALIMLLLAPFGLTLVMGFAFGGGSTNNSIADLPVAIVNLDEGELGAQLVDVFESEDLSDLLAPQVLESEEEGRTILDSGDVNALVLIPADFTSTAIPSAEERMSMAQLSAGEPATIRVLVDPAAPLTASIVSSVVETFAQRVSAGVQSVDISFEQLLSSGILQPQQLAELGEQLGGQIAQSTVNRDQLINLNAQTQAGTESGFNWAAYVGPSMALLFLMFGMTGASQRFISERQDGTLNRMLSTPTPAAAVIGGKVLGTFLTGIVQMTVLAVAGQLLLGSTWGPLLEVALLIAAAVAAATGWGVIVAALSRTPGQASALGTMVSLVFAIGAGNFIPRVALPEWLQTVSLISPNAWGLEGFDLLRGGAGLTELLPILGGLGMLSVVLYLVATLIFRRQTK